jgi:hypothetical protein
MRNRLLLAIFIVTFAALLLVGNCSDPLESLGPERIIDTVYGGDTLTIIDTTFIIDTLNSSDTLFIIDTILMIDTLDVSDTIYVVDTINTVDTVVIYVTDSTQGQTICAQINSYQKKIIWMLRTEEGSYKLEFSAAQDDAYPKQILQVYIDDNDYRWRPSEEAELTKEMDLGQKPMISIAPLKPPALGHPIYICLTISKL